MVLGAGCSSTGSVDAEGPADFAPAQRAVRIETTGCGSAPDRTGSGIVVGDGLLLTVAHLVARADGISAAVGDDELENAVVTAVDLKRDLALVRISSRGVPGIETTDASRGSRGLIVGGAASGTVSFVVKDVVRLEIEEILGTGRHTRLGYEVDAATLRGDSGSGAYDSENRLIGIVFATSEDGESTWITSSAEIEDFLDAHASDLDPIGCDEESSQLDLP